MALPVMAQSSSDGSATSAEAALRAGVNALRAGDAAAAVTYLNPVIASERLSTDRAAFAYFHRAAAHQHLKSYMEAINDYNQAIAFDTFSPAVKAMALYNRALCYDASRHPASALGDLARALKINPNFAQAYNARADIQRKLGRHQAAIRDYQTSLRHRHPEPHLSLYGQAISHAALRQKSQARSALERALVAKPEFALAREKLRQLNAGRDITKERPRRQETVQAADPTVTGSIKPRAPAPRDGTPVQLQPAVQPRGQVAANVPASGTTSSIPPQGATATYVPGPGFKEAARAGAGAAAAGSRPPPGSFLLQLSAQRNEDAARRVWRKLSSANGDVLGELTPFIQTVHLENKGTFFRLRAGPFNSRGEVAQICRVLKARGNDCFVAAAPR